MKKKLLSMFLVSVMAISALTGCGDQGGEGDNGGSNAGGGNVSSAANENNGGGNGGDAGGADSAGGNTEITEFSYFITMPGSEKNDDNEIAQIIAEKTGVKVKETWLTGQTASEATGTLIAGGEYPDFIDSDDMSMLVDAGALLPLDDYIDKYPEFRDTWFTQEEWDKFRQPDGHIYWINPFGNTYGESKATTHNDEAFWI